MRGAFAVVVAGGLVLGCGDAAVDAPAPPGASGPPALLEGYQRYTTAAVEVAPGADLLLAQWVAAPLDRELDVLDIVGTQSATGHHALMYATSLEEPVGTTRTWEDADQLATRFLGGVGGEAGGNVKLPEGVVFRVAAGRGLLVQTHYLNASTETVMAESVLDVLFAEPSEERRLASMFANTSLAIDIPPNQSATVDVECTLPRDMSFLMFANHMHEMGTDTLTERIDTGGATSMIKSDQPWRYEWAFNPNFSVHEPDVPYVVPAGSTIHTQCNWSNPAAEAVAFPREMCVFFGFFLGDKDVTCMDGNWLE
jgi:hypothetical protein